MNYSERLMIINECIRNYIMGIHLTLIFFSMLSAEILN